MNKSDRADLDRAHRMIEEARGIIEDVAEREQEKFDNMPEGLQATEKGQRMEEVASELGDLASTIDDILEGLNSAQE